MPRKKKVVELDKRKLEQVALNVVRLNNLRRDGLTWERLAGVLNCLVLRQCRCEAFTADDVKAAFEWLGVPKA